MTNAKSLPTPSLAITKASNDMTAKLDEVEQMQLEIEIAVREAVSKFAKTKDLKLGSVNIGSVSISASSYGVFDLSWNVGATIKRKAEPPYHPSFMCVLTPDLKGE